MTMVKICGITNAEDARVAADAGADAVGLVFAESPRRVNVELARRISLALPENILRVGVFVDEEPAEILRISREVGLDLAQLHGDETPETVTAVRRGGVKVMKALRVRDADSLDALDSYGADLILLDAYSERARGGTGERFDWEVAKSSTGRDNIVVSGGLGPETCGKRSSSSSPTGWTRRVPWRMSQAERTVSGCGGSSLRQETEKGYFGPFGGRYVPETLIHALEELEAAYERYRDDPEFGEERDRLARDFVGRPTS